MKKVLILFALLIGALSASADSYTITFKSGNSDSSTESNASGLYGLISEGADKVTSFSDISKVFSGINGVKLSSSKDNGKFTINLSEAGKVAATSVTISAAVYNNDKSAITINGVKNSLTGSELSNYKYTLDGSLINTIVVEATKRSYIKSITVEYQEVDPATHVSFSPNGGELADSKDVTMTALDAEENAVAGTTIYYKVGNGEELNGKSPLTITLDAPATVEAWVADQETPNSATFTFPVVQPSAPVFTVDDEVLSGEEVELPYGTEITISAENATSLDVNVNDEVTTVEGNSTTITITEDVIISVVAKNGELTDEAAILVTVKTPELTVKVGETVAENNGTYIIEQGTAIEVTATGAQSITILDKDGNEVSLQNNCFYPAENNYYMISAQAANKSADIEFDVVVTVSQQTEFTDVLTVNSFNVSGTAYKDVNYTSDASKIVYVGNIAGGNSAIQLRSKGSNSGIVINANPNGYVLKQIVVDWNSSTANDRQLDIYGADEAFGIAKMYDTNKPTNIGSLKNGSTTFEPTEDYSFIGLRSKSDAMYLDSITLVWEKKEYSAEGSISFGEAYSYDEYSKANVLTFTPTIYVNGSAAPSELANFEVLLNGVELGQADQAISHFAPVNGADNKFQLRKGTKVIDVDVTWPAINAKPAIKGARYVQNDDNTLDAIYNIAPEDETPGYSWLVNVSNEGAELGWTENAATCTFKNVGAEAVNAPANINAALVIPFAVKSTDGTAALAEGDEVYDVVEYSAPVVELSTAEVAKPNESNTSGVADVAVDQNSAAEYYNLQGVRVNGDLTPGLYIRRQGNQATKVVVR